MRRQLRSPSSGRPLSGQSPCTPPTAVAPHVPHLDQALRAGAQDPSEEGRSLPPGPEGGAVHSVVSGTARGGQRRGKERHVDWVGHPCAWEAFRGVPRSLDGNREGISWGLSWALQILCRACTCHCSFLFLSPFPTFSPISPLSPLPSFLPFFLSFLPSLSLSFKIYHLHPFP